VFQTLIWSETGMKLVPVFCETVLVCAFIQFAGRNKNVTGLQLEFLFSDELHLRSVFVRLVLWIMRL
jgi:hypothetical protein